MFSSSRAALATAALLCAGGALAQQIEFSGSPSPVGSGARAAGMGNAFVAIADDATAASWNPAGLVQLERPEISIVGSFNLIRDRLSADLHPELDPWHSSEEFDLNYLSAVYPLPALVLGRNVTVSLNYQRKYEFNRELEFDFDTFRRAGSLFRDVSFKQEGSLSALSPAMAVELTRRLSLGIAVNFWRDTPLGDNGWEQTTELRIFSLLLGRPGLTVQRTEERYEDFRGENVTLGLLWNVTNKFNIGLRYDSELTGDVNYKNTSTLFDTNSLGSIATSIFNGRQREDREVKLPASIAVGVSHRVNDRFTWSLDVTRIEWDDFYIKTKGGARLSLVDARNLNDILAPSRFDPTHNVRFGMEYVFLPPPDTAYETLPRLWTLRGGVSFDQEPASGRTNGFAWFNPGDGEPEDFYGGAVGVGLLAGQRVNIDAAYQVRYGPGVNRDFIRGIPGFKEDVWQHRFLLSTTIYFR